MKALQPYEQYLQTIHIAQFKRATSPRENEEVAKVWEEYSGENIGRSWGCSNCVYNLFKKVAQVYYATLETKKKKEDGKKNTKKSQPKSATNKSKIKEDGKKKGWTDCNTTCRSQA